MRQYAVILSLCCIFLSGAARGAAAVERITFAPPLLASDKAGLAATVSDVIDRASELIGRLYADSFSIVAPGKAADYTAAVVASQDGDTLTIVVNLKRPSAESTLPAQVWNAPLAADTPLWLARAVSLLWSSYHGFKTAQATTPPVYIDELPISLMSAYGTPMSIAVTPSGTVAAALSMTCVEVDNTFRLVSEPGKILAERSTPVYVGGVATTPGGSFLMKPSMGRDLYRLQPGGAEPLRMPAGLELSTIYYWAAYPDGSALLVDATNRKALRVAAGNKRQDVPLFASASYWPTAYAMGPEGSIWVYDPQMRGVRIYTGEGKPLDIVLLLVDPTISIAATALDVGPDGSFVLFSSKTLMKFQRDGALVWSLDTLSGSSQADMPSSAAIAVDWPRGLIYVSDITSKRIVKLLDREWSRKNRITNDFENRTLALRAGKDPEDIAVLGQEAQLYAAAGSTVMARAYWERVLDVDPSNAAAESQLAAIELQDLKVAVRALDAKARSLLNTIGIETARLTYMQALQKYELILSKAPSDAQTRTDMEALKGLFADSGQGSGKQKPLSADDLRLANLFPSLMQWYATHPAGSVTVKNPITTGVENVRVTFLIPQFMDLPVESKPVARLGAGESARFDLSPAFNQKVLELQEDMTTQVQVTVLWNAGGVEQSLVKTGTTTIYRNTALTWDDTRKIAVFITPNEQTISGFAARVIASGKKETATLSERIFQAMRICDALSIFGLTYVPDPDSPVSKALGSSQVLDTVRFPRTTLYNRTGDCDDTTALLCSLMEAGGIRTAVMTSPGHIFMAFDTGEPAENAASLSDATHDALKKDGKAWIPVETTVLSQGFMAAWASATGLVRANPTALEFLPVASMRDTYPALPLPPSIVTVAEPSFAGIEKAHVASMVAFTASLYTDRVKALQTKRTTLSGRAAALLQVQEGVLHAIFGKRQEAETSFKTAIAGEPTLVSPYVNLANLRLLASDEAGALGIVGQGLAKNADSALLNLLAARIYSAQGDTASTARYLAVVKKTAPDLAARYADLAGQTTAAASSTGGAQRAAGAGETPSVIWPADQ